MSVFRALARNGQIAVSEHGDAIVPWWSFGKTVIAAAALTLVRDGSLDLDNPLDGQPYTLRHLLQHRAGLTDYGALADYHAAVARKDPPWPLAELLQRTEAERLRYPPGQGWGYSNIGYRFVADLIARTDGAALDVALARRVFAPLGIAGARLALTRDDLAGVTMGEAADYDPGWVYHGLIVGPLTGAALLLDRLLDGELLPPPLLAEMKRAHPLEGDGGGGRPWARAGYGLGLMVELGRPDGPLGHTGGGPGSVIAVYRSQGTAPVSAAAFALGDDVAAVERAAFAAS